MENGKWKMENGKWKMENGKPKNRIDYLSELFSASLVLRRFAARRL